MQRVVGRVSHEAVTWAMDEAPMLLTEKGKPDTTARHVLAVLAERADAKGSGAYPSVLDIQFRTGYDERTIRRVLRRLEAGGLITADGTKFGCTNWKLALDKKRPATDRTDLEAERDLARDRDAKRKKASRRPDPADSSGVRDGESRTPSAVRDAGSRMSGTQSPAVRDATPPEPSGTVQEPSGGHAAPRTPLRNGRASLARTDGSTAADVLPGPSTGLDQETRVPPAPARGGSSVPPDVRKLTWAEVVEELGRIEGAEPARFRELRIFAKTRLGIEQPRSATEHEALDRETYKAYRTGVVFRAS